MTASTANAQGTPKADSKAPAAGTTPAPVTVPNMRLAELTFQASLGGNVVAVTADILALLTADDAAPLYRHIAKELKWAKLDQPLLTAMEAKNATSLAALDAKLADAEKNFGETEVSDALLERAHFFCRIGDKERALTAYRVAYEKAAGVGAKLDIIFTQLRIGLFYLDHDLITRSIDRAKALIDEGGDWDRRNRLKVYQGLYLLSVRDFKAAATQLLDGLATFTSSELMEYRQFVKYSVLAAVLVLPRGDLKKKVMESPEILEVVHEVPHLESLAHSLYNCEYAKFFQALAAVESYFKTDRYLVQQTRWYVREMRIVAYTQILESYRSLTIESMARSFGVSEDFIDLELSHFIAAGRLHCVVDKVGGVVETNRPDSKNAQYQLCIKQGDLLLNHVQKLSRVINI